MASATDPFIDDGDVSEASSEPVLHALVPSAVSGDDLSTEELVRGVKERHALRARALADLAEHQAQVADWLSIILSNVSDGKLFMIRVKVRGDQNMTNDLLF